MGIARRLALGRLISLSGGSAAYIALVAAIYGRTHSAVWVSAATLFLVDAATFAVSAFLVASIRRPFGSGATDEHPGVLAGVRLILRESRLRVPVLAGMVSLVGVGIVGVASYPLSVRLHGG